MAFSGTVASDFLKFLPAYVDQKEPLVDYAAGDFESIRNTLFAYAKAAFPLDYNNFSESDFGVFLIELMSAMGHIQSMKSDFLVNENFLRTARQRLSVKKLLELVGVRMKGPISAAANAKITVTVPQGTYNVTSITVPAAERAVSVNSPEDGGSLSYTLYKVNSNGTIDLESNTTNLEFSVTHASGSTIEISDAIILEGAFVVETGVFQSPDAIKTIALSQFPYVEKSSQVYVLGSVETQGVYTEEDNVYFASGGSDKIFQVTTDDKHSATVVFGDSTLGLSPRIGDTYTATYRIGGGERGNISTEVLNAPITVNISDIITAQATLENSGPGTGGAEAETVAHAKRYAPLSFRRQDRIVTLSDYKSFVNSFVSNYGSTGKANAVVRRAYSSANIIDVFVLEKASDTQLRKATSEYKRQLLLAIAAKKMLTDEPVVVDGLVRTIDLFATVTVDSKFKKREEQIKSQARDKIITYLNVDNSDYGEEFNPQDLIKFVLELQDIRYLTVDNIDKPIRVDFNEIIQLNNLTIKIVFL